MEESDRLLSANAEMGDDEESLRPQTLDEYIGQDTLKENLTVSIFRRLYREIEIFRSCSFVWSSRIR